MDVQTFVRSTRPIYPTMGNHFYTPGQQREVLCGDDQYYEDAAILFYGQAAGPPSKTHWKVRILSLLFFLLFNILLSKLVFY